MIYITGSSGFLGKHLNQELQDAVCIPHQRLNSYTFGKFEYFYFLSTFGNMHEHDDDSEVLKANVIDPLRVMLKTVSVNYKSFVFISTSSVTLPRQTMYSRSKKAAEEILLSFLEKYRAPICIIRPYSITGVGEQPQHLIPTLIRSCMTGELVNFVPNPSHDFIDVSDVVNGILNLSRHGARGIFELGTGKKYTNQEVLEIVEKVCGKKANLNIVEKLRDYDTSDWVSNNYRARGFGWLPKKSLEQSIKEMYAQAKKKNN